MVVMGGEGSSYGLCRLHPTHTCALFFFFVQCKNLYVQVRANVIMWLYVGRLCVRMYTCVFVRASIHEWECEYGYACLSVYIMCTCVAVRISL